MKLRKSETNENVQKRYVNIEPCLCLSAIKLLKLG